MSHETLMKGDHTEVSVLFDMVTITIHCGDDYKAQVLYDHIVEELQRGKGLTISMAQPPAKDTIATDLP